MPMLDSFQLVNVEGWKKIMGDPQGVTTKRWSIAVGVVALVLSILSSVAVASATLARFDERLANQIVRSQHEREVLESRVDKLELLCTENSMRGVEIKKDLEYIKSQIMNLEVMLKDVR